MHSFSFLRLFGFFLLGLLFSGCGTSGNSHATNKKLWMESNGKIKILATTAMIQDLVQNIGNGYIDSYVLIKEGLDPHSYQLVKGDDEILAFADIVFYNGLGLEHGHSLQNFLTHSNKAISLGAELYRQNPSLFIYQGGILDPHIWMDISLWTKTIPFIVATLSSTDPQHTEEYKANGEKLIDALTEVDRKIRKELHAIPSSQRYLVSSHDAFNYFTRSYFAEEGELSGDAWKKRVAAPEGLAPESQLSIADLQQIIEHLKKYNIRVLFPETGVSKDSIRKIVKAGKDKGLELEIADISLYSDSMGAPGSEADTYVKMMEHNASAIASYLKHPFPQEKLQ